MNETFIQSLTVMFIGMGTVLAFLCTTIISMLVMAKVVKKLNEFFPEAVPQAAGTCKVAQAANEDENIVRVSFSQYLYDYRTNMVEADRKYKGKELEIYNCYGVDMSQAMMHRSCDYYVVSGDWRNDTVLIYVDRADNHLVPEVLDNYFTIRGTQSRISYQSLDNCRIIQIGYVS